MSVNPVFAINSIGDKNSSIYQCPGKPKLKHTFICLLLALNGYYSIN